MTSHFKWVLGTYEIARNKARKAESDSDLSTTDMENDKRKRKKVIYSSDDDQEGQQLSCLKEPRELINCV